METQCDQMTRLFIQHWATCNNGNLDNSKKVPKVGSTFCQILKTHHLKIAKELKNSKGQSFAKSGHTEGSRDE